MAGFADVSDWHMVNSDWSIPEELLPASAFQLRWFCMWEYDIGSDWGVNGETIKRRWEWQISDPALIAQYQEPGETADPIEAALFNSQVEISIFIVTFGVPGASLYVWSIPTVHVWTPVPLKPPIIGPGDDNWTYEPDTGHWHNPKETIYTTDEINYGDLTNNTVIVECYAYSNLYEIPLPAGAKVSVPFHNIGAWSVGKRGNLQIRTVRAAGCALRDPDQGVSWFCQGKGSGFGLSSIHDDNAQGPYATTQTGSGSPVALLRSPRTTGLLAITSGSAGVQVWHSARDGQEGTWVQMATVLSGVSARAACLSQDGGTIILLGQVGGVYHVYRGDIQIPYKQRIQPVDGVDSQVWVEVRDMGECVNAADSSPLNGSSFSSVLDLSETRGSLHILAMSGSNTLHFTSRDGGRTWQ